MLAARRIREDGRAATLDHRIDRHERRFVLGLARSEQGSVPGDFLGRVAQEINVSAGLPHAFHRVRVGATLCEQCTRAGLCFAHQLVLVDRALQSASQCALGAFVEFLKERRFPRIPELGIRAAHVRDCQHVEIVEMGLIADNVRELANHLRVSDVLLLRGD